MIIIKCFEYLDKAYNYKTSKAILGLYQINESKNKINKKLLELNLFVLRGYDCILGEVSGTVFKNQLFMLYGVETS